MKTLCSRCLVLVLGASLSACSSTQVFRAESPTATLRVHAQEGQPAGSFEQTHDGLRIEIRPVVPDTVNEHPAVRPSFSFAQSTQNSFTGQTESTTTNRRIALVPYGLTFAIKITNNTGHVLRFSNSIVRLADQSGRTFSMVGATSELVAWNQPTFAAQVAASPQVQTQLQSAVSNIMLFSRSVELLDRDEWRGFLVFNGFANNSEYPDFMGRVERLTLRIAEVPIAMNEAGAVARTTEFSFVFDKSSYAQPIECTGSSPADRSNCHWLLDPTTTASSGN